VGTPFLIYRTDATMNQTRSEDPLRGYPVVIDLPVQWGDMDAFGHINNTVYFRYFESARIAYLRAIGFEGGGGEKGEERGPILASTHCRFRKPLVFPDTVRVGARTTEVGEDRFVMEYRIVSEKLGGVVADGGGTVVSFDYREKRKARLPDAVRGRIEAIGVGSG
jgi:acyl-CoA thioester hydrolase